ncbi:kelch-like, partial [Perkinsus olseni]
CQDFLKLTRELDTSTSHLQGLVQLDLHLSVSVFGEVTAVLDELTDFREPKPPATVGRSLLLHANHSPTPLARDDVGDQGVRLFVEGVGRHLPSLLPWRVVSLPGGVKLRLRQESVSSSFKSVDTDKTGCAVWECGIILAYCLCQAFLLRGKSCAFELPIGPGTENYGVELGCGTGLVSLALASLGAKMVATDGNDQVLKLAERNLRENQDIAHERVSFRKLMWGCLDDAKALFGSEGGGPPSVVVGSDLVYPQSPPEPLLAALDDLGGHSSGTRAIVCLKERTRDSSDFLAKARARGWLVTDLAGAD